MLAQYKMEFCKADLSTLVLPLPTPSFQINRKFLFPVHKYIHQPVCLFSSSYPFNICLDIWKVCLAGEEIKKERSFVIVQWDFCSLLCLPDSPETKLFFKTCSLLDSSLVTMGSAAATEVIGEPSDSDFFPMNQGLQALDLQERLWPISLLCFPFISLFLTLLRWSFVIYHKPVASGLER